jgi:GNAT superfamily N-acetyltransferase
MGNGTIITEAVLGDIPDIHRVRMSVRENVLRDPSRVTDADIARVIERAGKGWVCRIGGSVCGFSFANGETRNIWALFVEPGFERRGIGRRLHDRAVHWLFERGCQTIWLATEPDTRAEGFYRAADWTAKELEPNGDRRFELTPQDWRRS